MTSRSHEAEEWIKFDSRFALRRIGPLAGATWDDLNGPPRFWVATETVTSSTLSGVLLDEKAAVPICGATLTIADSTAAGWSGPLGDELECQLEPGHPGSHRCLTEWDDDV